MSNPCRSPISKQNSPIAAQQSFAVGATLFLSCCLPVVICFGVACHLIGYSKVFEHYFWLRDGVYLSIGFNGLLSIPLLAPRIRLRNRRRYFLFGATFTACGSFLLYYLYLLAMISV